MSCTDFLSSRIRGASIPISALMLTLSLPASAHHPMGGATPRTVGEGFLSGIGHPIIGADHFAFLVVAMFLAYTLKGRARYLTPLVFVIGAIAGTVLHLDATSIPMAETLIALSVVAGAGLALTRNHPGAFALSIIFAASGILHGYAYGEAIIGAQSGPLLAYLMGLSVIQYALIGAGIFGLEKLADYSEHARALATRVGGGAALVTGSLFLALSLS